MPNTGQFHLLRVDGQADEAERLLAVTAVECNCLPCGAPRLLTTQGSTMSIHQVNICGFAQMLRALRGQLDKADAHALTTGYSSRDLLSARLAADMYPLAKQIQFACTQAREAVCRLTGQPLPVLCTPGDMDQTRELIDETLDHLAAADAAQIDAGASLDVAIELAGGLAFDMKGSEYAANWATPQFYFHLITAYNILRHNGVPLGKADYVPHMFAWMRQAG
ncbi:DUF1993 family protein [Stenotrophomonas sp. SAM-B]|uniref:DUF1993 domain-containing protein n=1 Tax=Stenotrophomonas sp. SAM-B TaxID=2729141 RepID=UPI001F510D2E|nr:DUF1993 domain-containing protein [Stenotrophomonas sp. SAM-B]